MRRGQIRGLDHCCFHVTHRCQERRFLLRFEIDRRNYVERLRQASRKYAVAVLDYVVTSNHVHLLLWTAEADAISAMMQSLQGATARDYNRRKRREGAFWRDRYHPTLIENGAHLQRCLLYIDLNLVRAGVVEHPAQWRCSGYHELCGRRQRYRVLDKAQLVRCLGHPCDQTGFAAWYQRTLEAKLASGYLVREALWTECVAVGGQDWVQRLSGRTCGLRHEVTRHPPVAADR